MGSITYVNASFLTFESLLTLPTLGGMTWPKPFLDRMKTQLGDQSVDFLAALEQPAPVSIRLNPRKVKGTLPYDRIPWTEHGYYLPRRPIFTLDPWWHAGAYYVQEASSMLLEQAVKQHVEPKENFVAVDLCGAPGGKSTHLASLLSEDSLLISNEVIRQRAHILSENLQKWGSPQTIVTQNNPGDFAQKEAWVDLLVVDAPCSGEGLFRRDPKAAEEWSPSAQEHCVMRQRDILEAVWPALKPGGWLIYSTCTFFPGENEKNLQWLSRQHDVHSLALELPVDWGITEVEVAGIRGYYCLPHLVKGEGFFLSILQKQGEDAPMGKSKKKRGGKQAFWEKASQGDWDFTREWVNNVDREQLRKVDDQLILVPQAPEELLDWLGRSLNWLHFGVEVGEVKKKNVKLAPGLALSCLATDNLDQDIELSYEDSLRYLSRENLSMNDSGKGWVRVGYEGVLLGHGKRVNTRINNYFPEFWKIRMNWQVREEEYFSLTKNVIHPESP